MQRDSDDFNATATLLGATVLGGIVGIAALGNLGLLVGMIVGGLVGFIVSLFR